MKDCLWAFATLDYKPSTVFLEASAVHCERTLSSFTSQNVANAMWAFSKLSFQPSDRLLAAVDEQVSPAQADVSNKKRPSLRSLIDGMHVNMCQLCFVGVMYLSWSACQHVPFVHCSLLLQTEADKQGQFHFLACNLSHWPQVVTKGQQYQPQNMSNIAWAFASWRHHPTPAMFDALEQHLLQNLHEYSAQVGSVAQQLTCACICALLLSGHVQLQLRMQQ